MKKIALLALLFSGLLIFTTAIAVFASGMPIDTVKTVPLDPQTTGTPADNGASNGGSQNSGANTTNQNPAPSTSTQNNMPSTDNDHGGSWMDGWQWSVCPDESNA